MANIIRQAMKRSARGLNAEDAEGGPGSGRHAGVDMHPADKQYIDRWKGTIKDMVDKGHTPQLPSGMRFTSSHAQYAKGLASEEGGPGSGPRGKFAPREKSGEEDRLIAKFTRRENPAQRTQRISRMRVDPERAKVFKKLCVRATLAEQGLPEMSNMHKQRTTRGIQGIGAA